EEGPDNPWEERPILSPCQRENRRKALWPLPLNQPPPLHPSTFSLLASSFFFCLSGDKWQAVRHARADPVTLGEEKD
ncbi:hypothetical protein KUCAC02_007726, partial [Chaenocephalus aceratus]